MNPTGKAPRGYFSRLLIVDTETSGLFFNQDDPSYNAETGEQHQVLSIGAIVVDAQTLKYVDKMYVEIKHDASVYQWSPEAERVHKLSRDHLAQHGVTHEEAAMEFADLILKHWGPQGPVHCCGQNVITFDIPFLRRFLRSQDIHINFGTRHIDTFSIGWSALNVYNSDQLFEMVGVDRAGDHNALEDALASLKALRMIKLCQPDIKPTAPPHS